MQGLIWGLATGDLELALNISVIFELFWLDLIPAGTYIPPNTAASNLACLALMRAFGLAGPAEAVFPILLCLPLGWIGARLEEYQRTRQNSSYDALLAWARGEGGWRINPGGQLLRSILQIGALHFLFFVGAVLALASLVGLLRSWGFLHPPQGVFSWGCLWVAASFGGILSLRSARAYAAMATGAILILAGSVF